LESHKSGGRPAPPDGSAEYDFRFRAEEKLAVYLAAVARLVHLSTRVEHHSRARSFENAEVEVEHNQRELRHRIAWLSVTSVIRRGHR
jgi:hypothetical protein